MAAGRARWDGGYAREEIQEVAADRGACWEGAFDQEDIQEGAARALYELVAVVKTSVIGKRVICWVIGRS